MAMFPRLHAGSSVLDPYYNTDRVNDAFFPFGASVDFGWPISVFVDGPVDLVLPLSMFNLLSTSESIPIRH